MKRLGGLAALAVLVLTSGAAFGNGRFPSAGHVEVDPMDPAHVVLRATYGLVASTDGGARWSWVCEEAMSFAGIWDPPIGITAGGALLVGLPDGLSVSTPDGCGFSRAGALEGKLVADLAVDKTNPARAVVLTSSPKGSGFETRLYWTEDGGASFTDVDAVFPDNLHGLTVDLTPDPAIVYVSGVLGGPLPMGVVLRSADGGKTHEVTPVPGSDDTHGPFIGAVDPADANSVYVRLDGAPGRLLHSADGAKTWEEIFVGEGSLLGFSLSPDGSALVVGGEKDGIWRSPAPAWAFEQVSRLHARCLRWAEAGVYACTEQALDGFSVGLSVTAGSTFGAAARIADLCGPIPCPAGSTTRSTCEPRWPIMQTTLNAMSCDSTGAGGGGAGGGPMDAGVPPGGAPAPEPPGDCACGLARGGTGSEASVFGAALAALGFIGARRARRRGFRTYEPRGRRP
ncbi:hypothetical protein [Polyangium sp. 15x6]|uniref:WD40/YVTN/BNR-like repeat-containing protein n=1 Tax=Polyangium sp. 15x6 TaxID=3042687 RepID=UPI00249BD9A2|nr:hypothetical protein [Polyangium sp. 15x6]MDI3286469.1 hypothetical protein [Polyangium sp. 15x6]